MQQIRTADDVRAWSPGYPFTACELPAGDPASGWATDTAAAWVVPATNHRGRPWLTACGSDSLELMAVIQHTLATHPDVEGLTVPRELVADLPSDLRLSDVSDWEWWDTDHAPPVQLGEQDVAWLPINDPVVVAEIRGLLERSSPTHWAPPGHPHVRRWCGVRSGEGRLVACAAETRRVPEVAHLASVATDPDHRGQGLARAVTAWLTREILAEGSPIVTLGMYAHNKAARAVYTSLGFNNDFSWTSGVLPNESPAPRYSVHD